MILVDEEIVVEVAAHLPRRLHRSVNRKRLVRVVCSAFLLAGLLSSAGCQSEPLEEHGEEAAEDGDWGKWGQGINPDAIIEGKRRNRGRRKFDRRTSVMQDPNGDERDIHVYSRTDEDDEEM